MSMTNMLGRVRADHHVADRLRVRAAHPALLLLCSARRQGRQGRKNEKNNDENNNKVGAPVGRYRAITT